MNRTDNSNPFGKEYKGNAAKNFERFIYNCYKKCRDNQDQWHSPCTAIVQSSGYGKSRMCKEFACTQTDWLTVYICYRKEGLSGYPTGNRNARRFMTDVAGLTFSTAQLAISRTVEWLHAWRFVRIAFHRHFCQNPLQDYDSCWTKFEEYIDGVSKESGENYLKIFDNMKQYCNNVANTAREVRIEEAVAFWNLCEDHTTAATLHMHVEKIAIQFILFDEMQFRDKKLQAIDMPVFFVFDEARFLWETEITSVPDYTMFRAVRGALTVMDRNVFAVFVDSISQVNNVVPTLVIDSSYRYVITDDMKRGTRLFRPYIAIETMDVLSVDLKGIDESHHVFLHGRPLWKATYDGLRVASYRKLEKLKDFAESKLKYDKTDGDEIVALVSIAIATDMSISPIATIVDKLVGSHMATCLAIEDNHKAMMICYPVEPILSEVVLSLLKKYNKNDNLSENILQHLISHLRIGTLNDGFTEELVVKLLLLLARGRASEPFERCSLDVFLAELIGKHDLLPKLNKLDTFQLSFTCFTKVMQEEIPLENLWMHKNPQEVLQAFYERNAALEFPMKEAGAVFLLPVKSVDNENEFKYILVPLKNKEKPGFVISEDNLTPQFVFGKNSEWCKYAVDFSLLINVSCVLPKKRMHPVVFHAKRNIIEIKGLDIYEYISEKTKDDLKKMLKGADIGYGDKEKDTYTLSCRKLCHVVGNSKRVES